MNALANESRRRDFPKSPLERLDTQYSECLRDIERISEQLRAHADAGDAFVFLLRQARGAYAELEHIRRLRRVMTDCDHFPEPAHPNFIAFRGAHIELLAAPPMYVLEAIRAA